MEEGRRECVLVVLVIGTKLEMLKGVSMADSGGGSATGGDRTSYLARFMLLSCVEESN